MYKEKIIDAVTGEESWRDFTKDEIAALEAQQKEIAASLAALEEKQLAKKAILEKLGLTEEEAKVLLG